LTFQLPVQYCTAFNAVSAIYYERELTHASVIGNVS